MKWKIIVVPHTHWDKEWYFTKEESDVLLLKNLNDVTDVLQKNKDYKAFNFDGQSSIIDDYLQYKPENLDVITKLIKEKKLIVGPWYTQPDLFNITSESIVRNLLIGIKTAKKYGGNYLNIGYAPDSFGHNAQMPQIYKGFDLNSTIFWRGLSKEQYDSNGTLFNWKGIDGTSIKAYNFYNGYWVLGSFFPYEMNEQSDLNILAKDFLFNSKSIIDNLKEKMKQKGVLLIPLGGDQGPINKLTAKFFDNVNKNSDDEWILGTYEDYFDQVNKNDFTYGENTGELKHPYIARIHKTIGSMRYDIKKLLKTVEYKLYNQLEPLCTYLDFLGVEYPTLLIEKILKKILVSQAHDSAGGCNSDRTNDNVISRLKQAEDLIDTQINFNLKILSKNINLKNDEFLIFNNDLNNKKNNHLIKLFSYHENISILDDFGKEINFEIISKINHDGGKQALPSVNGEEEVKLNNFYEYNLNIFDDIEKFEFKKYLIKKGTSFEILNLKNNFIENDNLKISIDINTGIISLLNKNENENISNIFEINAKEDNGDSYDYSPLNDENKIISKLKKFDYNIIHNKFSKILNIKYYFEIPKSISNPEKIEQLVESKICINEKSDVYLDIYINNKAKNIKWLVNNFLNNEIETSLANQAFHTIERKTYSLFKNNWLKDGWKEYPAAIETNESFISAIINNKNIMSWFTFGNNEYEIKNNNFTITLFRSVDVLGRHDLKWRPGRASGTAEVIVETPKATLINENLIFSFKISFENNLNLWKEAKNFTTYSNFYQQQSLSNLFKKGDRFMLANIPSLNVKKMDLRYDNDNFIITCFKKTEDSKSYLLRGFNSSDKNIKVNFSSSQFKFIKTNLLEKETNSILNNIDLKPFEILTLRLEN